MRYGIISDVHEDLSRLKTAIAELSQRGVDRIISLGDIIDPDTGDIKCLDFIMKQSPLAVIGNHDKLTLTCYPLEDLHRDYLESIPEEIQLEKDILMTHANPLQKARQGKGRWYTGSYIYNDEDAREVFENCDKKIILVGHTHIPRAFWESGSKHFEESEAFQLDRNERYILNPGAVGGYVKDTNPSISCAVLDTDKYIFEILRIKDKNE